MRLLNRGVRYWEAVDVLISGRCSLLVVCLLPAFSIQAPAQTLDWVRSSSGEEGGWGAAWGTGVDDAGSVYVSGGFELGADFDGDGLSDVSDAGFGDAVLVKYDNQGAMQWLVAPGGVEIDQGRGIAVDGDGSVYMIGFVGGDADFDGDGTADIIADYEQMFLAKYDADGSLQWVRSVCGRGEDVAIDASGSAYVTGTLAYCADFDRDGVADISGSAPFVAKYTEDGEFQWFRAATGSEFGDGLGVAVDPSGNVYYTGSVYGRVDFSGDGTADVSSTNTASAFLAKYNSTGGLLWVRAAGSASHDSRGFDVIASAAGNVFMTGLFEGAADFNGDGIADAQDAGSGDAFLASYDSAGDLRWVQSLGSTDVDEGHVLSVADEVVYMAGSFSGQIDIDSDGIFDLSGFGDSFLVGYHEGGELKSVQSIGGPTSNSAHGLATDQDGSVYLAGSYSETADLDGDNISDVTSPRSSLELFVAKFEMTDATHVDHPGEVPFGLVLEQNYPNPFNPTTVIRMRIPETSHVVLTIHDLAGRRVSTLVDGILPQGSHEVYWDVQDESNAALASGIYIYRLSAGIHSMERVMTLLR